MSGDPAAHYLEISITVPDGELAEAVAEVLGRYISEGVLIQATGIVTSPDSEGRPIGPYRVSGYIPEDGQQESTRDKIERGLKYLGLIRPLPEPEFTRLEATDWVESWKQHYRPIRVGRSLTILPAWEENADPGRLAIRINPGMAFGTGTHPTTLLALELMEEQIVARRPGRVFDIGCGSGILSIAAALLGAGPVVGVDIDPDAIENARENVRINTVEDRVELDAGSLGSFLSGKYVFRRAELVVANILAHILIRLLDEGLADLTTPGGSLVLSGVLEEREGDFLLALKRNGLETLERRQTGDWIAFLTTRAG